MQTTPRGRLERKIPKEMVREILKGHNVLDMANKQLFII